MAANSSLSIWWYEQTTFYLLMSDNKKHVYKCKESVLRNCSKEVLKRMLALGIPYLSHSIEVDKLFHVLKKMFKNCELRGVSRWEFFEDRFEVDVTFDDGRVEEFQPGFLKNLSEKPLIDHSGSAFGSKLVSMVRAQVELWSCMDPESEYEEEEGDLDDYKLYDPELMEVVHEDMTNFSS